MTIETEAAIKERMEAVKAIRRALVGDGLNRADSDWLLGELYDALDMNFKHVRQLTDLGKKMDRADIERAEIRSRLENALGEELPAPTKH